MTFLLNPYRFVTAGAAEDARVTAWAARHQTPPTPAFRASVDKMVKRLRAGSLFNYLDRMMLGVAETPQAALVDLLQPDLGGIVNGTVAHRPKKGWQGDGATGMVDLGENFPSQKSNTVATPSNFVMGVFVTEPSASGRHTTIMGAIGQTPASYRYGLQLNRNALRGRIGDTAITTIDRTSGATTHEGHFTAGRLDGTKVFYDNAGTRSEVAVPLVGISTTNTTLLNVAGAVADFTIGLAYMGSISDAGIPLGVERRALMDTIYRDFMREIGALTSSG